METLPVISNQWFWNVLVFFLIISLSAAGGFCLGRVSSTKRKGKTAFQFFSREKLYNFKDAFIFLQWCHGTEGENHTFLVRFQDMAYFRIEFHNYGISPEVVESSKENMIKELKNYVKLFPDEVLAALKLIETT